MEIARKLGIDHKTVLNHSYKAGYKKKLNVWVPYELSVKNMMDRINICDTLLKRNEIEPFLKRMMTSDEKWITYDNHTKLYKDRKRKGTNNRKTWIDDEEGDIVWWDWKGIVHYELIARLNN
ncbi:PREDICTED: histone-lysine N-methyltransferase SETMAR-like [Acromyrmex echinatior]|uniref:histone-lysine N-methyltransferase SETMAR-like n=1 Tax=Acromyrmex echinatior TaxID=103372 RepID=UPI000580F038|nr:PREDICTED: histone-lysine N-methyltransferase SETMAR-like [Acromyrmex echinatior]